MKKYIKHTYLLAMAVVLLLLPLSSVCYKAGAQAAIVNDPANLAQSITNSTNNIEEMLNMLQEMFNIKDVQSIAAGLEKVESIAQRFNDAGQLASLTEQYMLLLNNTVKYSRQIQEWAKEDNFNGYRQELDYIYQCQRQGKLLYDEFINFFSFLKTNDAEKHDQIQKIRDSLATINVQLGRAAAISDLRRRTKNDLVNLVGGLDKVNSPEAYASAYEHVGTVKENSKNWITVLYLLNALTFIGMIFMGYILFFRGDASGMNISGSILMRWFIALVVSNLFINLMESLI